MIIFNFKSSFFIYSKYTCTNVNKFEIVNPLYKLQSNFNF